MKIRNPRLLAAAGWLGTRIIRTLFRTLRFEYRPLGPDARPPHLPPGERLIYCIWHENLLLPTTYFGCPDIAVLVSKHADGQLLGSLVTALGMGMVCGSTNRGGIEAVRKLVRDDSAHRHLAVTPDGPRGPRRVVQPGLVYIASRTGMKIVPVGVGYLRPWRLKSWDRFAIPRPCSRARCLTGEPIAVPASLRAAELDPWQRRVQAEMERLNTLAEQWATTGKLDAPAASVRPVRLAS